MSRWRCVLFDVDGTLLDYRLAQASAVDAVLAGLEGIDRDAPRSGLLSFVNSTCVQAIEACKPGAPGAGSPDLVRSFPSGCGIDPERFLVGYFRELGRQAGTIPGAADLLGELRRRGVPTAAVSNGPGPVQRPRLAWSGLMGDLGALVLSCEVGFAKPSPEIFGIALKLLGCRASDSVMVGDGASSDMAGAEGASMDFIYFRQDGDFSAPGRRIAEATGLDGVRAVLFD